jgi:hypothetical protein
VASQQRWQRSGHLPNAFTTQTAKLRWTRVPDMRFTAVHGLDDDDPAMAEALGKLAALE